MKSKQNITNERTPHRVFCLGTMVVELSLPDVRVDTTKSLSGHLNVVNPSKAEDEQGRVAQAEERVGRRDVRAVDAGDADAAEEADHGVEEVANLVQHDDTFTGVLRHS